MDPLAPDTSVTAGGPADPSLATSDSAVPDLQAQPIKATPDPMAPYEAGAFGDKLAASVPDRIPTVSADGSVGGNIAGYATALKQYDPLAAAAIKAGGGPALQAQILQDRQMEEKIASAPAGTDPLQDHEVFTYAAHRGLVPTAPGGNVLGQAVGDLWSAAKGASDIALLQGASIDAVAVGDVKTLDEAQNDTGEILKAGIKSGMLSASQLALGAGEVLTKLEDKIDTAVGSLTPAQADQSRIDGEWAMYKVNTKIAGYESETQRNLQQVTQLPPAVLQDAVNSVSFVANPANYLPVGEAFSAVTDGAKSMLEKIADKSLPGLSDSLAVTVRKAQSTLNAANAAFDALANNGVPGAESDISAAATAVKGAQTAVDAATTAHAASVIADEAAQKAALIAPRTDRWVGQLAQFTGKALTVPAAIADKVTSGLDSFAERVGDGDPIVKKGIKSVANSAAGGIVGVAADTLSPDHEQSPWMSFVAGALGPQALKWVGTDMAAAGRQLVMGRVATPYFARLAMDTAVTGPTRWVANRFLDPLTPFVTPILDKVAAGLRGAAAAAPIGAAYGFAQTGGTLQGAAAGATGILPLGFVGGLAGSLTPGYERNQATMTGEANRQYLMSRWQNNSVALDRFNSLPLAQQTELANRIHANPDITPLFTNRQTDVDFMKSQGKLPLDAQPGGFGGATFKGTDGRVYVALNPDDPQAFKVVVSHELRHAMQIQDPALAGDVRSALIGSAENGTPGIFTKLDADGKPLVGADGQYATNDDFQKLKQQYVNRVSAVTGTPYAISDADFALEHDAEESAQTWLQTDALSQAVRPTMSGILMSKFQDVPWLRSTLAAFGHSFNLDGEIQGTGSTFKGLKASPVTQKLIQDYTSAWARRSPDAEIPEAQGVDLSPDAIAKNPGLLSLLDTDSSVLRDPKTGLPPGVRVDPVTGKAIVTDPTKLFKTAKQINDDTAKMTAAVMKAVEDSVAANPGSDRDAVSPRIQDDGSKVMAGRYFTVDQIARIKASGTFNDFQLAQLLNLNGLLQSGDSNFIRSFYQPALKGGKYASRSGHWVEEIPYGFKLTKADNITIQSAAPDKLARNLERLWSQEKGPARGLWSSTAEMFRDADQYLRDLGAGKPGATTIGDAKRDAINAALGIKGAERGAANPVYDATPQKSLTPMIVSRRLDRTNRMQPGLRTDAPAFSYKTYEAAKENFRPDAALRPEDAGADETSVPGSPEPQPPERVGLAPETDDTDQAISSRNPTGVKATEDPLTQRLVLQGSDVFKSQSQKDVAQTLRSYPGIQPGKAADVINSFTKTVKDNLLFLHDQMAPDLRDRAKQWYVGGRKIVEELSAEHGVPRPAVAGVLVALSPKTEWFTNIELAKRAIVLHKELTAAGQTFDDADSAYLHGWTDNEQVQQSVKNAVGKAYADLSPAQRSLWARARDNQSGAKGGLLYSPEGNAQGPLMNASGTPTKVSFGLGGPLAKALSILDNPTRETVHLQLGTEHKVRSFYNNLLLPNDPQGDVTIDTHAVGAGLMLPVSSNSEEVAQNFGGAGAGGSSIHGTSGLYALYADAYRQAAQERGLLPREMQSITWEGIRSLFPAETKTAALRASVDNIWKAHKDGELTADAARAQILDLAGGIRAPSWAVSKP